MLTSKPVTQKMIAQRCEVSVSAVADILGKRSHLFNARTPDRVLSTARELGYRPSRWARAVRTGRLGAVGLLAVDFRHFPWDALNGIEDVLSSRALHALCLRPDQAGRGVVSQRTHGRRHDSGQDGQAGPTADAAVVCADVRSWPDVQPGPNGR